MNRWRYYNPNPKGHREIDCTVRAVSAALGIDWDWAFCLIMSAGFSEKRMGVSNGTWALVLRRHGFRRAIIPNTCPDCYTVEDFCIDHPRGIYVLCMWQHIATVRDGYVWDSWDSTREVPQFYWYQEDDINAGQDAELGA